MPGFEHRTVQVVTSSVHLRLHPGYSNTVMLLLTAATATATATTTTTNE